VCVDQPIARRGTFDSDDAKVSTLSTEPHSSLVLILTANTESTVLFPVDVQSQTERRRVVTMRLKRKISCSVKRTTNTDKDNSGHVVMLKHRNHSVNVLNNNKSYWLKNYNDFTWLDSSHVHGNVLGHKTIMQHFKFLHATHYTHDKEIMAIITDLPDPMLQIGIWKWK